MIHRPIFNLQINTIEELVGSRCTCIYKTTLYMYLYDYGLWLVIPGEKLQLKKVKLLSFDKMTFTARSCIQYLVLKEQSCSLLKRKIIKN